MNLDGHSKQIKAATEKWRIKGEATIPVASPAYGQDVTTNQSSL